MASITPAQQQLKQACETARQALQTVLHTGASRSTHITAIVDFFRACQAYALAGGNIGFALWDIPIDGEINGRLNSSVTAWQTGIVAYPRHEITTTSEVWAVLLPRLYGPPELPRFNVSPVGQIGVHGLEPTPESRFLMMRVLDPGPMAEAEIEAATVGNFTDWLWLFWLALEIPEDGAGATIHATA